MILVKYKADNIIEGYVDNEQDFDTWLKINNDMRIGIDEIPENKNEFKLIKVEKLK